MHSDPARHCAILAGGTGSRMGGNKHLARVGGRRLAEYPIKAALEVGLEPVLVAKPETPIAALGDIRSIREPATPRHPLLGILAALEALEAPIVVCPCDTPLVPGPLLGYLSGCHGPCTVVRVEGQVQPLLGRWGVEAVAELRSAVLGEHGAAATVMRLGGHYVEEQELREFGDPATMIRNLNTGAELAALDDELRGTGGI